MLDPVTNPNRYGPGLPAVNGSSGGGRFALKRGVDLAHSDAMLVLFTPKGTRPMRRSFGSGVWRSLFEPPGSVSPSMLQYVVNDSLSRWAPHVSLQSLRTSVSSTKLSMRLQVQSPSGATMTLDGSGKNNKATFG